MIELCDPMVGDSQFAATLEDLQRLVPRLEQASTCSDPAMEETLVHDFHRIAFSNETLRAAHVVVETEERVQLCRLGVDYWRNVRNERMLTPDEEQRFQELSSELKRQETAFTLSLAMLRPAALPPIPTLSLLGYLVTILVWELEVFLVLLAAFGIAKLDPLGHSTLLIVTFCLTIFAWIRRNDFQALRGTRGRILLTRTQSAIVTLFIIAYASVVVWALG